MFEGGELRLVLLKLIADEPRHGYELSKLIHTRSGGQLTFHIDSLYPLLYRLEERGWIKSDDPKFYAVNGLGAFMIAVSIAADYDSADLGGIAVEIAWVFISLLGIWKYMKGKAQA